MQGRVSLLVENDLGDAGAVAHINEDEVAEIAAAVHPAHKHGFFARVRNTRCAAHVRTSKIA